MVKSQIWDATWKMLEMAKHRDANENFDVPGRDKFIIENCLTLVPRLEMKTRRQRKAIEALDKRVRSLKLELKNAHALIEQMQASHRQES